MSEDNGWNEYKQRILFQLDLQMKEVEKIDAKVDRLITKTDGIQEALTILKTKASIYGGLAGFAITIVVQILFKFLKMG